MNKNGSQIAIIVLLLLVFNEWTMSIWLSFARYRDWDSPYYDGQILMIFRLLDLWLVTSIVWLMRTRLAWGQLFRESAAYLATTAFAVTLLMLASNPVLAGKLQWLRLVFPLGIVYLLARAFHRGYIQPDLSHLRTKLRPLATGVWAILTVFFLLEGAFMFVAKSSLNDNTLASKIWFERYWEVQRDGYREAESDSYVSPVPQLFFIGDSFLAGHGIKDPDDRFSNRVQKQLLRGWKVHNHGQNGASTNDEVDQMNWHNGAAKLIVLCWFLNDVDDVARQHGLHTGNEGLQAPWPISLIHGSYLCEYLAGFFPDRQAGDNYLKFLHRAYADPIVMEEYQRQLFSISHSRRLFGAKFAVVLFPMMNSIDGSEFALKPMREYWQSQNIPCLDLSPIYKGYTTKELTVNASDSHPSVFAHDLAGDAIYTFLKEHQLLVVE